MYIVDEHIINSTHLNADKFTDVKYSHNNENFFSYVASALNSEFFVSKIQNIFYPKEKNLLKYNNNFRDLNNCRDIRYSMRTYV